jgi:hypothetical protein
MVPIITSCKIEAPIPLMLRGVPEEDTLIEVANELMGHTQRLRGGRRREWCLRG